MSAHADAGEIMRWLSGFTAPPAMTYLVHGEPVALEALRDRVTTRETVAGAHRRVSGDGRDLTHDQTQNYVKNSQS